MSINRVKLPALLIVVVILPILIFMIGCSEASGDSFTKADWSISIDNGHGQIMQFTAQDAATMETIKVEAVLEKETEQIVENWEGIPLSEVLENEGIDDYNVVEIEASDGYSKEFEASTIKQEDTILGFFLNDQEISEEEGLVQLVVPSMSGKFWIKNVSKIKVLN